jgi:hypothetical protein
MKKSFTFTVQVDFNSDQKFTDCTEDAAREALDYLINEGLSNAQYDENHDEIANIAANLNFHSPRPSHETSSMQVMHWRCYGELAENGPPSENTHQIDIADQRSVNGQVYVDISPIEGKVDSEMCIIAEINTSPIADSIDHVPCVHVRFDGDNLALSIFKIGDDLMIRRETDVHFLSGPESNLHWVQ